MRWIWAPVKWFLRCIGFGISILVGISVVLALIAGAVRAQGEACGFQKCEQAIQNTSLCRGSQAGQPVTCRCEINGCQGNAPGNQDVRACRYVGSAFSYVVSVASACRCLDRQPQEGTVEGRGGESGYCIDGCRYKGAGAYIEVNLGGKWMASGTWHPTGEQCGAPSPPTISPPKICSEASGICYSEEGPPEYCGQTETGQVCVPVGGDPPMPDCKAGDTSAICIGPEPEGPPEPPDPPIDREPDGSPPDPDVTDTSERCQGGNCVTIRIEQYNNSGGPGGPSDPGDPPDPGGGGGDGPGDPPDPGGGGGDGPGDPPDPGGGGGGGGDDDDDDDDGGGGGGGGGGGCTSGNCSGGGDDGGGDDGGGDDGGDDPGPGSPGASGGPLYSPSGKTMASVWADFRGRLDETEVMQQAVNFLNVGNLSAGCPTWEIPATEFFDAFLIDMHCRDPYSSLWAWAGYLMLALAAYRAFQIAFDF